MNSGLPPRHRVNRQAPSAVKRTAAQKSGHRKGTAYQRGYGPRWTALSIVYRRRHTLCERCLQEGRDELSALVDHIKPTVEFPELMLDWKNLWALCEPCHGWKYSLEEYARKNNQLDLLPTWCRDPSSRPAQFRKVVP